MKAIRIGFIAILLFMPIGGCASPGLFSSIGDFIVGVDAEGNKKPGPAPIDFLGIAANVLLPGVGGLAVGGAGAIYQGYRKRQWQNAFQTTAQVIETGAELGMSVADIKPHLADAHAMAGVDHLVQPVVQKITPDQAPIPVTPA